MKPLTVITGILIFFALCAPVQAHKASDGFLYLDQTSETPTLRVDIALRDLTLALPMDRDGDSAVTGREFRQSLSAVITHISERIELRSAQGTCGLSQRRQGLTRHSDGPYAGIVFGVNCPGGSAISSVRYRMLQNIDSQHRGLLSNTTDEGNQLLVLQPGETLHPIADSRGSGETFLTFLNEGIIHLVLGYDHVLFLLALILPATIRSQQNRHQGFRQRILTLAGIVTAFTIAHSITLALAALEVVTLPIAWVELIIALSITVAAINLFWPILGPKTWKLAFGFGLIHGFGFASVLGDLVSGGTDAVIALAGFNIGVELGQVALVAVIFPLLYLVGHQALYRNAALPVMAIAIGGMSLIWAAERVTAL